MGLLFGAVQLGGHVIRGLLNQPIGVLSICPQGLHMHALHMCQGVSLLIDVCVIVFIHFNTTRLEVLQLMKIFTGCNFLLFNLISFSFLYQKLYSKIFLYEPLTYFVIVNASLTSPAEFCFYSVLFVYLFLIAEWQNFLLQIFENIFFIISWVAQFFFFELFVLFSTH